MRLHYTLFAQNPSGDLSDGLEATVNAQEANYGLFSIDNSGQVSDAVSIKIIYVLNNYTLYGNYLGEFSTPLSDSCIVAPMQVPRNLRVVEQYTTHKTIKLKWDAIEGIERYAIYVRDLETSEAWKFESAKASYIALNLRPNSLYEFKVAAHIQYDFFSETSLPVVASTLPAYFGHVDVYPTIDSIRLGWENVADAAYYIIYPGIPGTGIDQNYSLFAYDSSGNISDSLSAQVENLEGTIVYPGVFDSCINENYSLFVYDSSGNVSAPLSAHVTSSGGANIHENYSLFAYDSLGNISAPLSAEVRSPTGMCINENYSLFAYDLLGNVSAPLSAHVRCCKGTRTCYLAKNLQDDTQYLFYIVAYNSSDMPITATYVFASTLALAPAFSDAFFYTIERITTTSIEVSWEFAVRAHHYRIHINNNPEPHLDFIYQPRAVIKGLSPDTIYTIKIVAVNSGGEAHAPMFSARTARGGSISSSLIPPRLIYPNCSQITTDFTPSLYWQPLPPNSTSFVANDAEHEFSVGISTNQDFTVSESFNSAHSKTGFSYNSPVVDTKDNKTTLNFRTQIPLTKP